MTDLATFSQQTLKSVEDASTLEALDEIRVHALGKKGFLTEQMKTLGGLDPEVRKQLGQDLNKAKGEIAKAIDLKKRALDAAALDAKLKSESIDVTLPVAEGLKGSIHPISQTIEEIVAIFGKMGFSVAEGPDAEDDFHNFEALNFPQGHPAREMQDTFYLNKKHNDQPMVLRTHTSPVQIRTMLKEKPPIRIIVPGRTYRQDHDATHSPMFHQVEGLVIEKGIHMGHLKATLKTFCEQYFGVSNLPMRFRPSFFPFTEPSVEVDIGCKKTDKGLEIGDGEDWLEILGAGMVHPNVLKNCGLDPKEHQGFAFGVGLERISMLKYGMPDLRPFFESDIRWLDYYGFAAENVPVKERSGS